MRIDFLASPRSEEKRLTVQNVTRLGYVFDLSCPWCYIGFRSLRQAVSTLANVTVQWHPFLINPEIPAEGLPFTSYMERRFGGSARLEKTLATVRNFARQNGLNLTFDRIQTVPNTLNAHALVQFAQERGDVWGLLEDLFSAYFCQGRDIGDVEELSAIGSAADLKKEDFTPHLTSSTCHEYIRVLNQQIHAVGLNRVPCLVVDGRYALPGAQDADTIQQFTAIVRDMA